MFDRLIEATNDLNGDAYKNALQNELKAIGREIATVGSELNKLNTK